MALNEYLKTAGLPLVSVVISVQVSATRRDAGEYFAENLEQKIDEKMANLVICVSLGRKIYKLVLFLPFSILNMPFIDQYSFHIMETIFTPGQQREK